MVRIAQRFPEQPMLNVQWELFIISIDACILRNFKQVGVCSENVDQQVIRLFDTTNITQWLEARL